MRLSASQRESLAKAVDHYYGSVAEAAEYLKGRGITGEVASMFRLGYVADPLLGDEDYQGRLAIPYITESGPVDIRFRALTSTGPKYLGRPGSTARLFNVRALTSSAGDTLAICEGEFDAIVAHGLCDVPAVGVPGATQWREHWPLLFQDWNRVFVLCDGDSPGRDFGKRVAGEVEGAIPIHMPDGMDVNDVYLAEGPDGIRKRVGL